MHQVVASNTTEDYTQRRTAKNTGRLEYMPSQEVLREATRMIHTDLGWLSTTAHLPRIPRILTNDTTPTNTTHASHTLRLRSLMNSLRFMRQIHYDH